MRVSALACGVAVGLLGGMLAFPAPVHALLTWSADVSGTSLTCRDQEACDIDPVVGQLALAPTTINGVLVTGSFSHTTTNPFDLLSSGSTSVINQSGATRNIAIAVGDINFTGPTLGIITSGSGTFIANQGNSIVLKYYVDNANTQGANSANDTPGSLVDTFNFTQTLPATQSFSHDLVNPFVTTSLFSMTEQRTFTLARGASMTSLGQTAIAVPEPASLAVFGAALAGFGIITWRRRQAA